MGQTIENFLRRHRTIALDTNIFIYHLEGHPRYAEATDEVFHWVLRPRGDAVTSIVTLLELLVQPYRAGNLKKSRAVEDLFYSYPNISWFDVTLPITGSAARIRAEHRLHTVDAIQAATAVVKGATGFITNDPVFTRVPALDVLVLERAIIQ